LIEVKQNGSLLMSFFYDGDGERVKSTLFGSPANTNTYYIGNHTEYEVIGLTTTLRRYFYAGSTRVAMRVVDGATNPTYWLLNDQLGSTAITADASGALSAELRFKAWGEQRYASGTTPTTYRYTGQREQSQLSIYFYGARWYDPQLSRFLQPDSIIPLESQGVQAWDRYAYANNNSVRYNDPTGHTIASAMHDSYGDSKYDISLRGLSKTGSNNKKLKPENPTPPPPFKPSQTPKPTRSLLATNVPTSANPYYKQGPTSTPTPTQTPKPPNYFKEIAGLTEPDLSGWEWWRAAPPVTIVLPVPSPGGYTQVPINLQTVAQTLDSGIKLIWGGYYVASKAYNAAVKFIDNLRSK
jgi:RHS repeat-associated protein